MRVIFSFLIIPLFTFAVQLSCQQAASQLTSESGAAKAATATPTPQEEEAPRISLADAKADFDKRSAIFVDTRPESSYKQEHVKGSINLPLAAFDDRYKELPKDKKIIAYCS
jgi:predicted sulfurtransferase